MADRTVGISRGLVEGVIDALTDKHSQVDLHLRDITLSLGNTRLTVRPSGSVTVAVPLRELSNDEKAAHSASTVSRFRS